jgi:hypothetical protein
MMEVQVPDEGDVVKKVVKKKKEKKKNKKGKKEKTKTEEEAGEGDFVVPWGKAAGGVRPEQACVWFGLPLGLQQMVWSFLQPKDLFLQNLVCLRWRAYCMEDQVLSLFFRFKNSFVIK